ncbi:MAG: Gfo/Idh/MocA family oxidoreductase [Lentisphaerae bacterium]|jgi:predicted dehydrogenase|nr:Gfo/Idh/MocA family oxidoreductase [Lentisphaerota bacterium]MBT4822879.1 Gfo/Idh/MocA family oxidoreductase [Lentisphaerota bacterium]MBT5612645.1 Gfo/Idh/MocA family oxidoreductase [Lentisphaerota bacterium]MBT7053669.1 Gfo/Idh/MocA family oxidoreductase [Lentisphaerota bacterium]MBT7841130.1 Gfo/Idh/MocA family oxidoreductase [Lentisphaerota bacterium]
MGEVRWLLVGAGDIAGKRVAPALTTARHSRLVAVCDIDPERASELAARHDVGAVYSDFARALSGSEADTVYVATPQSTHIELSLQALAAGKHLLCEKPLGLNGAECLRLLAAARTSDRVISCSNYRRLSGQYRLTETMLARQQIGDLVGGWAVYSSPFYHPGNAPISKALGHSRIKEQGYYLIDIVHGFFGMPSGAMAQASTIDSVARNDVEDLSTVVLTFPGGEIFTIVFNSNSPGVRHEMEFFGSSGRIHWPEWPPYGNGPVVKITRAGTEKTEVPACENWHLPMIEDYVDARLCGRSPVCTLESAVKTELITDAIFRSIESGKVEAVDRIPLDLRSGPSAPNDGSAGQ